MRRYRHQSLPIALAAGLIAVPLLAVAAPAAAATAAGPIVINEIESDDAGGAADWVELLNTGATAVDISGYVVKDSEDAHALPLPTGTSLAAGAYLAVETDPPFGLGKADGARLFAADGTTLVDSYSWTAHAASTYGRCADGTGGFVDTVSPTRAAPNACPTPDPTPVPDPDPAPGTPTATAVRINEIEAGGGTPGDWVELVNRGATVVDVTGWALKDDKDSHEFSVLPAGSTIAAGGHLIVEEAALGFGLGDDGDSVRLYLPDRTTLVDSYTWTSAPAATYGRCPDGSGAFTTTASSTKGAANDCSVTPPPVDPGTDPEPAATWPGGQDVSTVDRESTFGENLSGLQYEAGVADGPDVLWGVLNGPGTLYRLVWDGTNWVPDAGDWSAGKLLHYSDGAGNTDTEGVTFASGGSAAGIFASTERNNSDNQVSKPEVLRFDPSDSGTELSATMEWDLSADLATNPATTIAPNAGLEGISWVPDSYLVGNGFIDESTGEAYDPARYGDHADGLFFVGLEQNGNIYAYALNQSTGAYTRVATIAAPFESIMELEFEPETNLLWAVCDNTCEGRTATLAVADSGAFAVTAVYERPAGMPNLNNEGFAIAPQALCVNGEKPVFWSDDADGADDPNGVGHALRAGTLDCTEPTTPGDGSNGGGTAGDGPNGGGTAGGGTSVGAPTSGTEATGATATGTTSRPLLGSGILAQTGADVVTPLVLGVLALLAGICAVFVARRRRQGPAD